MLTGSTHNLREIEIESLTGRTEQDDVHPKGKAKPQEGRHHAFRRKDERTYILRMERGRKRISRVDFGKHARGRTP